MNTEGNKYKWKEFTKAYYRGIPIWTEKMNEDYEGIIEAVNWWQNWWLNFNIWFDSKYNLGNEEGFPIAYPVEPIPAPDEVNLKINNKYFKYNKNQQP